MPSLFQRRSSLFQRKKTPLFTMFQRKVSFVMYIDRDSTGTVTGTSNLDYVFKPTVFDFIIY